MEEKKNSCCFHQLPSYLIVILLLNILLLLGFFWWSKNNCIPVTKEEKDSIEVEEQIEEEILTVNYGGGKKIYDEELVSYYLFQLQFSSRYSVVNDEMYNRYDTQGGFVSMYSPVLFFSPNGQKALLSGDGRTVPYLEVFAGASNYKDLNDWDTQYLKELEQNITPKLPTYEVVSKVNEIKKENYTVYKRSIRWSNYSEDSLQAFIFIPEKFIYIFESTGVSEKDFDFIVDSLKIREFIDWDVE